MSTPKILVTWLGNADLTAPRMTAATGIGPIAQALEVRAFDEVVLLADRESRETEEYVRWLRSRTRTIVRKVPVPLSGPTEYGEIYEAADRSVLIRKWAYPRR